MLEVQLIQMCANVLSQSLSPASKGEGCWWRSQKEPSPWEQTLSVGFGKHPFTGPSCTSSHTAEPSYLTLTKSSDMPGLVRKKPAEAHWRCPSTSKVNFQFSCPTSVDIFSGKKSGPVCLDTWVDIYIHHSLMYYRYLQIYIFTEAFIEYCVTILFLSYYE